MKRLVVVFLSAALLVGNVAAFADGYRRPGHYHGPRYYPHHRHDGYRGRYLAGGLLLGSLLTHAFYSAPPREV